MISKSINLDEVIDRREVATLKFDCDTMQSIFNTSELWPSWVADMDFKTAPKIITALQNRVTHGIFGYETSSDAIPQAVSAWYRRRYQWDFNPQHIINTPRTLNSLATLITLFSDEGDGVIVQPPVFYDFKLIIRANKRQLIKNPLKLENGQYQMDFDQLESVAAEPDNRLLILCNPQNPIARVWSAEDLSKLVEICSRHDVFIISDEIHGDITYQHRYTPLASISELASQQSATCISPIKSFNLAGVANSMIVIANDEKRKICADWYSRFEINKNNVFCNAATLAAYTEGETWLEQVIKYLKGNIEYLKDFLAEKIPVVILIEPQGSFLLWLDFRGLDLNTRQLEKFLVNDAHMATNPGQWFGREGIGFARINIACPRSVLSTALAQLEVAIKQLNQ